MYNQTMKKLIIIAVILIVLGLLVRPPVSGGRLTSWWGIRFSGPGFWHAGSDIGHATGTPINPVSAGTVKETGFHELSGNYVNITHIGIVESRYYHLDRIDTAVGDKVNHSTVIGTVGNTGFSTGPHLHYEIRLFGIPLPAFLLSLPGTIFKGLSKSE